jgi:DNA polymerase III alpha subunit (gram-positive type)
MENGAISKQINQNESCDKQYLFFDIEACDGYHMCSFGYVLVDKNFKVLERRDILMNPEEKFNFGNPRKAKITLDYSESEFKKNVNFAGRYAELKEILTKKNTVYFGHSVRSDIIFLKIACEKYKLPEIEVESFDTQKMFQFFRNESNVSKLTDIVSKLNVKVRGIRPHNSEDDALLTMYCLEAMCTEANLSIDDFIKKHAVLIRGVDVANARTRKESKDSKK